MMSRKISPITPPPWRPTGAADNCPGLFDLQLIDLLHDLSSL
jgi:hypothetical protein